MASYIAAIAFCIFLIRGIIYVVQKVRANEISLSTDKKIWAQYLACFVSGVLFANAIPHFVHGISGEDFPAPFGKYLGAGFSAHLSNVIWGFVNIVAGYNLFIVGKFSGPDKLGKVFFFAGFLIMSIFLSFVFSH